MLPRLVRHSAVVVALLASSPAWASVSILDAKIVVQPPGGGIATGGTYGAATSKSGRYVALATTAANLAPGFLSGNHTEILWIDTKTGERKVLSRGPSGILADGECLAPRISSNGKQVCFLSNANNLGAPGNGHFQAYLVDAKSGEITVISRKWNGDLADADVVGCDISGDGKSAVFITNAANLFGNPTGIYHLYVYDVTKATVEAHSFNSSGAWADASCFDSHLSDDGRYVVYWTSATNLPDTGAPMGPKIIVHDRKTGKAILASKSKAGIPADAACYFGAISGNGRYIAYRSNATNLTSDAPSPGETFIFVTDRITGDVTRHAVDLDGATAEVLDLIQLSDNGRRIAAVTARIIPPMFQSEIRRCRVIDRKSGHVALIDPAPIGVTPSSYDTMQSVSITGNGKKLLFLSGAPIFGFAPPVSDQTFELSLEGL